MALATYTDLLAQVATWLARSDLTANIPDFVALAEQRIAYGSSRESSFHSLPLRIRAMETYQPIVVGSVNQSTAVSGTANAIQMTPSGTVSAYAPGVIVSLPAKFTNTGATTLQVDSLSAVAVTQGSDRHALVGGEIVAGATVQFYHDGTSFVLLPGSTHVPLPTNYLAMREIYIDASPRDQLDYLVPESMNRLFSGITTGKPEAFTIEADAIRLAPSPDTSYSMWAGYYKKFPALSSSSTNWLMTNAPSIYLYGALLESAPFIAQDDRVPLWHQLYLAACDGLQVNDERDRHSGTLLTMRSQKWTP